MIRIKQKKISLITVQPLSNKCSILFCIYNYLYKKKFKFTQFLK